MLLPFAATLVSGLECLLAGLLLWWLTRRHRRELLARDGFVVSPRLAGMINGSSPQAKTRWATALFTGPDGRRYRTGDVMRNPAYARTVQALATEGPGVFYGGRIGREIARSGSRCR